MYLENITGFNKFINQIQFKFDEDDLVFTGFLIEFSDALSE